MTEGREASTSTCDPYCPTHCSPGHKHSQCSCGCDHAPAGREASRSTCLDCGKTFDAEGTADLHGMTKGHAITSGREASVDDDEVMEGCGYSYDHTTDEDTADGLTVWTCRECGAEGWEEVEDA